ncbi:MAG: prepilin peptidase [Candidatus Bathyarchaeia archaeon]
MAESVALIDAAFVGATLVVLLYASWKDLRVREVPDEVWMAYAPFGVAVFSVRSIFRPALFTQSLISIVATIIISATAFYLGVFGGRMRKPLFA